MKLCRFELKAEPGIARSGMVYSGKIYETNGAEAIAVHEAADIRPLTPIPHAPSVRIFHRDHQPGLIAGMDEAEPSFFYLNPTGLFGASQSLPFPMEAGEIGIETFLAAVMVSDSYQADNAIADDLILGYTLLSCLVSRTWELRDRRSGVFGRAYDLGAVLGPVVSTPDEMEDFVSSDELGRRYALEAVLRVNGIERGRGNTELLPVTAAQAIVAASQTLPVRSGDIIAIGPLTDAESPITLGSGDDVQLAVEGLGAISLRVGE